MGQNNNIDWNEICNTIEFALYNSCEVYVDSFGQLTYEGERAMGCIRNGLALGGGAAALGTPLEMIISGLDILAGMTGCDGIVKLDLLSTIGNPSQLLICSLKCHLKLFLSILCHKIMQMKLLYLKMM